MRMMTKWRKMMTELQYTPEEIADILSWKEVDGMTWAEVINAYEAKYGIRKTINALRHVHTSYKNYYDSECAETIVEQLKKNLVGRKQNLKAIKQNKMILEYLNFEDELQDKMKPLISKLNRVKFDTRKKKKPSNDLRSMTIEILLSDLHIGMIHRGYDYKESVKRIRKFVDTLISEIDRESKKYNVDRIILALMGDIINSATMHGRESTKGCEFGNSEQVVRAIELLFREVIVPLSQLGIEIDVPCVTGNHDRAEEKKSYVDPGEGNLSWIIYTMLEMLCDQAGLENVRFSIARGVYNHTNIYNNIVLYEHGDALRSLNRASIDKLIQRRQQQIGKMINFYRFGHFHEYTVFGQGKIICNASLCGKDGYADALGFISCAAQTINFYVQTKNRPTCFFKSFPVYLGE
jgi:hypothetical protein